MLLSIQERDWPAVASLIERSIDLEGSARTTGALTRKRQVRSASDLLRLALAYGPGGQSLRQTSLRQTAAWADLQQVASLSDVALLYRFRESADWLAQIAGALVAQREASASSSTLGLRLRVVDASVISAAGKGPRWRLHSVYDVAEERFSAFELTDTGKAEALEWTGIGPGELVMGDRVYARPGGLHHVVEAGGEYLIRVGRKSLRLGHADGRPLDLAQVLDDSDRDGLCDLDVVVLNGRGHSREPLPARLVVTKKPPEGSEKARKLALRQSQRGVTRMTL